MKEILKKYHPAILKTKLSDLKNRGFFDILLSSLIVKAISFVSAMFLPRFLAKGDYGALSFAETILSYLLMVNGLGVTQATLKFCVAAKNNSEREGIFHFTTIVGVLFDLGVAVAMLLILPRVPFTIPQAKYLVLAMIFTPLLAFVFQNVQMYLRANFQNRKYSFLSMVYSLLFVGAQIALALFAGLGGVVFARYFAYTVCILLAFFLLRGTAHFKAPLPPKKQWKPMLLFSVTMLLGNMFSLMIANNETFLVGTVFDDAEFVATYKVASYALQICVFFTDAVMVFAVPYFSKKAKNRAWIWAKFKKLMFGNLLLMTAVVVGMFLFAKQFVLLFFGREYLNAVPLMRTVLIAAFSMCCLRGIPGNILAFVGQEKYTLRINIFTCVLHLITDYLLFTLIGRRSVGIGLILVYSVSGIMMLCRLRKVCKIHETMACKTIY